MKKSASLQENMAVIGPTIGTGNEPAEPNLPSGLKLIGGSIYIDTGRRGLFRCINDYLLDAFRK